jgi:hypothetical protein
MTVSDDFGAIGKSDGQFCPLAGLSAEKIAFHESNGHF